MNKFEYLVETTRNDYALIAPKELEEHLNSRGKEGWELVNAIVINDGFQYELIFKRNA